MYIVVGPKRQNLTRPRAHSLDAKGLGSLSSLTYPANKQLLRSGMETHRLSLKIDFHLAHPCPIPKLKAPSLIDRGPMFPIPSYGTGNQWNIMRRAGSQHVALCIKGQ
jgi:hypothetical protein